MEPYNSVQEDLKKKSPLESHRTASQENLKSSKLHGDHHSNDKHPRDQTLTPLIRESSLNKLSSQQSDLDVSADMFQKYQQSIQKQNIGPAQLKQSIESIIQSIHVEQWKNIPMPVCISTTGILTCINDLKRFALYMEHRFSNLTASTNQSIIDVFNIAEKLKADTEESIQSVEKRNNDQLAEKIEQQDKKLTQKLAELKAEIELQTAENTTREINQLKPWVGKLADDKVFNSERKQTADYMKKIKEVKDSLLVPELIGPVGCLFPDFQIFVQKVHEDLANLVQSDEKLNSDINAHNNERKQTELLTTAAITDLDSNLKSLMEQSFKELQTSIKALERQHLRGQAELQDKIKEQDLGAEVRVKTKIVCQDWNDKVVELELLQKQSQNQMKEIGKLTSNFQCLESYLADQKSESQRVAFELQEKIQKQEKSAQEMMELVNTVTPKNFKQKGSKAQNKPIKTQSKPTEQEHIQPVVEQDEHRQSPTLLKQSASGSKVSIQVVDQEKQQEVSKKPELESYEPKQKIKQRKSSGGQPSGDRSSKRSGSRSSYSSLKKQRNSNKETNVMQSHFVNNTIRSRIQSAKPSTFVAMRQHDSIDQVRYENEINITKNFGMLEMDELNDRVRQIELQLIKIQRIQTNALQKSEREKRKQIKVPTKGDRSLAGILELGKPIHADKPKSKSNSPENKQLNGNNQLNVQSRAPLQWKANTKRWVKEQTFAPDLNIGIGQDQERKLSRSRSRDKSSKAPLQVIRDQPSSSNPLHFVDPSLIAIDKSQDLYSAESNPYILNRSDIGLQKQFTAAGVLLNNPSNKGLGGDNPLLFDKRQVVSREFQTDESNTNFNQVKAQAQGERKQVEILQSHAQIYYKQEGIKANLKKRPMTGVRAQDLTKSFSNFQQNVTNFNSFQQNPGSLPSLKDNQKPMSSHQSSAKQMKLSFSGKV